MRVVRVLVVPVVLGLGLTGGGAATAHGGHGFSPGATSIGDPYFPGDGNGGYDVQAYDLDLRYTPSTDVLAGRATIRARATQNLSTFTLDLDGLTVRQVLVDGKPARWSRRADELTVRPARGLERKHTFTTVVRYDGVPKPTVEFGGPSGFIHTDDGALVVGQPHVADTWFPVNDHPSDKARYHVAVTVPRGLTAVSNGSLVSHRTAHGWTTWVWDEPDPMASYLATASVGEFRLSTRRHGGIRIIDAVDPDLYDPVAAPRTGSAFVASGQADSSYKRLVHTVTVPASGAELSFWVTRATEESWDHFFVEAHPVGSDAWTTLPDANGHTSTSTGNSCPGWLDIHPFLEHYQTAAGADEPCTPTGTTGSWNAATGLSDGPEQWRIDLSPYAGQQVEVSLSYASDDVVQLGGVFVDDVVVSTGEGTTSFEADADPLDGWSVPGPPPGSPGNEDDWTVGGTELVPPSTGAVVDASFAREGEVLDFLSSTFGPYPFRTSGGIVDDVQGLGFALENQTRPIYSRDFFSDETSGVGVIVHELAHQWYGDSVALERWKDIWLNEGFATYAEWLWSEDQGTGTAQEIFDGWYSGDFVPQDSPFWDLVIGDPGPDQLFDNPVYIRGAMTLHQLRVTVGDRDFRTILRRWAAQHRGGNGTTKEFVRLAEKVSGQQLDTLFREWLYTPGLPEVDRPTSKRSATASSLPSATRAAQLRFAREGVAGR